MTETYYHNAFIYAKSSDPGQLSKDEVVRLMQELNEEPNHEELEEMMKDNANQRNGALEMSEYIAMVNKRMRDAEVEQSIYESFRNLDVHNSGQIKNEDFKLMFSMLANNVTDDMIDDFIFRADPDGDGFINYMEFIKNNFKS